MERKKISELLNLKRVNRVQQFDSLSSKTENKEELRELEMKLLTPEPIPEYVGEERRYHINSEHSVKFVFSSQEEMDFFNRHIPIAEYKEKSITDIKIILDLFRAIESGDISYDKKSGCFTFNYHATEEKKKFFPRNDNLEVEVSEEESKEPKPKETYSAEEELKKGVHMFAVAYRFDVKPLMLKYIEGPTPYLFELLEGNPEKYFVGIPKHGSPENLIIIEIFIDKPEKVLYTYDLIGWRMNQEDAINMEEKEIGTEQTMQQQETRTEPEPKPEPEQVPKRILFRRKQA